MTIRRDQILIVDLEATCWEGLPPPDQQNEIIEVGVCLLDINTLDLSAKRSLLVKPERSKVSPFCTALTTLTQEQVDGGMTFAEACAILEREYRSRERVWASWGIYDLTMFKKQCRAFGVRYPFSKKHLNLKRVFADYNNRERLGMARALEVSGLSLNGTQHRGDDDAWNIGRLLRHMLQDKGQGLLWKVL